MNKKKRKEPCGRPEEQGLARASPSLGSTPYNTQINRFDAHLLENLIIPTIIRSDSFDPTETISNVKSFPRGEVASKLLFFYL